MQWSMRDVLHEDHKLPIVAEAQWFGPCIRQLFWPAYPTRDLTLPAGSVSHRRTR